MIWMPDVYFDGKINTNLSDNNGNPMQFVSKTHKARFLRERQISEVGDRVHGAPYNVGRSPRKSYQESRGEVREAIGRAVQEMRKRCP